MAEPSDLHLEMSLLESGRAGNWQAPVKVGGKLNPKPGASVNRRGVNRRGVNRRGVNWRGVNWRRRGRGI